MKSLPSLKHRVDAFDGLRALAALGVYYCHSGNDIVIPPIVIRGHTGVHLFFVLSGYLLFSPFLKSLIEGTPAPSTGRFYLRRFLRIYPPYLVALVLFTLIRFAAHLKPPGLKNIASHLFLLFNYFDRNDFFSINAAFWTLAIEAQFYLLLPLVVWAAARLFGRNEAAVRFLILALIAVGIVVRIAEFVYVDGAHIPRTIDYPRFTTVFAYLDLFAFGMLAAYLDGKVVDRIRGSRTTRIGLVTAGIIVALIPNYWSYLINANGWLLADDLIYTASYPVLVCLGFALILLAVCGTPEGGSGLLTWRPLVFLGQISYSLYLYHIGVEYAVAKLDPLRSVADPYLRNLGHALIAFPPTVLVSVVMYYAVERPFQRRLSRFKTPPKPVAELLPTA